jgi:hypothetical protein
MILMIVNRQPPNFNDNPNIHAPRLLPVSRSFNQMFMNPPVRIAPRSTRRRFLRIVLLLAGIIVPQFLLYGRSLTGSKILLPLEILARPGTYLPANTAQRVTSPPNIVLSDLVFAMEPFRAHAAREVRDGRLPLWNPYNYCGSPFLANNQSAIFSPYRLLDYLFPSPITLAWTNLTQALVAGIGAYLFFRRSLRVRFYPALIGAWCYPLTGALVFWTGFTNASVISVLPWVMHFVDATVRHPTKLAPVGLALFSAFALVAGHSATAGQLLLAAGAFGLFRTFSVAGCAHARLIRLLALTLAFPVGILLAAPQLLPTLEYLHNSYRMSTRLRGENPTEILGTVAIAQALVPYSYGTDEITSWQLFKGNIPESGAPAYAGSWC